MTNGYIVLTKGEPNLYKHAVAAIDLGKPVYYADGNKVAFVNSIELDSTNVIIKTSDKQITVTSNGTEIEAEKGLYMHEIICDQDNFYLVGVIYTNFATEITKNNILSLLTNNKIPMNAYNGDANAKIISASLNIKNDGFEIGGLYYDNNNELRSSDDILDDLEITFKDFNDTVIQIF